MRSVVLGKQCWREGVGRINCNVEADWQKEVCVFLFFFNWCFSYLSPCDALLRTVGDFVGLWRSVRT